MFYLDTETADLIASRLMRAALGAHPTDHYLSVEGTVNALRLAGKIDGRLADYVEANADRFCMLPPPRLIEPMWYYEASRTEGAYARQSRA
jgi:hypothetical protein